MGDLAAGKNPQDLPSASQAWVGAPRPPEDLLRVRRLDPGAPRGLSVLLATTSVEGAPFGLDLGIVESPLATDPVFLESVPDCGCDACDSGSEDLLETLDGWILTVARGGLLHARDPHGHATRTVDGWQGQGGDISGDWLEESRPAPAGVRRWSGDPWL